MKCSRCLFLPVLLLFALAPLLRADEEKDKPEAKLNGTWVAKAEGQEMKFTFKNGTFTAIPPDPDAMPLKGTYKVDTSKEPNEMDMTITEGEERFKGKTALCIYELKGDTLRWCANDPARGNERAKEFPEKIGGGNHLNLVFKRVKE